VHVFPRCSHLARGPRQGTRLVGHPEVIGGQLPICNLNLLLKSQSTISTRAARRAIQLFWHAGENLFPVQRHHGPVWLRLDARVSIML